MATENLSLELPQAQNALADDVVKIADNFQKLDTAHGTLKSAFLTAQEELKTEITDKTEQFKTAITDQQTQFQTEIDEKTTQFQEKISSEVTRVETAFTEHREAYTQTIADVRSELKSETDNLRQSFNEALTAIADQVTGLEKFSELPYILASMNGNQLDVYLEDATNLAAFNKMLSTDGMVEEILKTSSYLETICASYSAWSLFKANATAMAGLLDDTTYPNTFTWFINAADFAENAANTTGATSALNDLTAANRTLICGSTTFTEKLASSKTAMQRVAGDIEWMYSIATTNTNVTARANFEIGFYNQQVELIAGQTLYYKGVSSGKFSKSTKHHDVGTYSNPTSVTTGSATAKQFVCYLQQGNSSINDVNWENYPVTWTSLCQGKQLYSLINKKAGSDWVYGASNNVKAYLLKNIYWANNPPKNQGTTASYCPAVLIGGCTVGNLTTRAWNYQLIDIYTAL